MLEMTGMKYTLYDVGRKTTVDNAIINLAGGQLVFDGLRNAIWFSDASYKKPVYFLVAFFAHFLFICMFTRIRCVC
jgi:hypothetical protein